MNNNSRKRFIGIISVTLASLVILFVFFNKILFSLNSVYFSISGDGIQSYFNTSYQIRHDTSVLYTQGINYPYGEKYIYTQSQLPVVIAVKLTAKWWPEITNYTVGIMNSLMLFSIVLGAALLFLIFNRLKIPLIISIPASIAIAGFSPQIDRMLGHFTLSMVWAIPLLIYLLLLLHEKRNKLLFSAAIGFSLFILATFHIYFVAFGFVISGSYLLVSVIKEHEYSLKVILIKLLHFAVQFVLPLLIYFAVSGYFGDTVTERPSKPYGFLFYKARPESIFLPLGLQYGRFLHSLKDFSFIQWEGMAYIGLTAVIGFIMICLELMKRLLKRSWNNILCVTDKLVLNILFWVSLILLVYSFGVPFIFGMEFLTDYIGPIKQLRAIGRFSWLFFYVINIVVIYRISPWWNQKAGPKALVVLSILMLFADAFYYLKGRQERMNNRPAEWNDHDDRLPVNQVLARLNADDYQAVIPLPFYHMGSESFNVPFRCDALAKACHVSLKTGLPIMAINSGRASVSQSAKNIAPVLEPYREYAILKDIKDQRPFLIVSESCMEMTEPEQDLVRNSLLIDSALGYYLYRIDPDQLAGLPGKKHAMIIKNWKETIDKPDGDYSCYVKSEYFYLSFDTADFKGYQGNSERINGQLVFSPYRGHFYHSRTKKYYVSYWLNPVDKDLFPKTRLLVELVNDEGKLYSYQNVMSGDFIKAIDGAWGLIEYPFELENYEDEIRVSVYNDLISRNQSYYIDEILLRPDSGDIVIKNRGYLMINNRWYKIN